MSQTSPVTETLPEWEDADVQLVYEMLCDPELNSPPNPEEHWEGWVSRNIVRGLRSRRYAQRPTDETLRRKMEEIHDITQDTTLNVECWQKLQNIAATAASALSDTSTTREGK